MNVSANDSRNDVQLIENFFGNADEADIDRQFGRAPSRSEIHRCIQDAEFGTSRRSQTPLDFRELEMDVLPNIYENLTAIGLYYTSSSCYVSGI